MKSSTLVLALSFLFSAHVFASESVDLTKVVCSGYNFDIKKNTDGRPTVLELTKEDQQFHVMFEGKIEGNAFRVVIEKSSQTVNAMIDRKDGEFLSARGGFMNGSFELGANRGLMMPVKGLGLSCSISE